MHRLDQTHYILWGDNPYSYLNRLATLDSDISATNDSRRISNSFIKTFYSTSIRRL